MTSRIPQQFAFFLMTFSRLNQNTAVFGGVFGGVFLQNLGVTTKCREFNHLIFIMLHQRMEN